MAARELRYIWRLPKGRVDALSKTIEDNGIIIVPINSEAEGLDSMNMLRRATRRCSLSSTTCPPTGSGSAWRIN